MVLHLLYNYNFLILKDMAGAGMIMEIIKMKERQGDKALDRLHDGIKTQMQTTANQGSWTGGAKPSQVVRDKTTVKEKPNDEEEEEKKKEQPKSEKPAEQKSESAPGSAAAPGSQLKESDSAPESDLQEADAKSASGGSSMASPVPMPMGVPGSEGGEGGGGGFANMGIIEMAQGASK